MIIEQHTLLAQAMMPPSGCSKNSNNYCARPAQNDPIIELKCPSNMLSFSPATHTHTMRFDRFLSGLPWSLSWTERRDNRETQPCSQRFWECSCRRKSVYRELINYEEGGGVVFVRKLPDRRGCGGL